MYIDYRDYLTYDTKTPSCLDRTKPPAVESVIVDLRPANLRSPTKLRCFFS